MTLLSETATPKIWLQWLIATRLISLFIFYARQRDGLLFTIPFLSRHPCRSPILYVPLLPDFRMWYRRWIGYRSIAPFTRNWYSVSLTTEYPSSDNFSISRWRTGSRSCLLCFCSSRYSFHSSALILFACFFFPLKLTFRVGMDVSRYIHLSIAWSRRV